MIMNNVTFEEMLCFAKVYSIFLGMASPSSASKREKDLAVEAMKKMADNRNDWTQEQKEIYKAIADLVKNQS